MTSKFLGRVALLFGAALLVALFAWEACAVELNIIQVYRNTPLSDDEPNFRDYYINGGTEDGLKKNLVVQVTRKLDVKDATGTHAYGELNVPVAQLRVVFAGLKSAVAREYKSNNFENSPTLEQPSILIGDKIDLKGSFVDNKKIPAHKSAAAPTVSPQAPGVPTPALEPTFTPAKTGSNEAQVAPPAVPSSEGQPVARPETQRNVAVAEAPQVKQEKLLDKVNESTTPEPSIQNNSPVAKTETKPEKGQEVILDQRKK